MDVPLAPPADPTAYVREWEEKLHHNPKVLHAGTVQGKTVHDALWQQHEMFQERATQETQLLKLELTEHVKIDPGDTRHKSMKRTCVGSPASLDEFAERGFLLVSSYPTISKSSMVCKNQRTG